MDTTELPLSTHQLLDVLALSRDPTAIHYGETAIIQYANDAMLAVWGKAKENVINKSLEDALPELRGQPFIDMFKQVWLEGLTISGTDQPAQIIVNGQLQTFYFDFEYRAIKNPDGTTLCVLHMAKDVTERVLSREREQDLTEELKAANEELLASNEEMNASNEELTESRQELFTLYESLADSDARFRAMVKQAPVGICIIRAADLLVQNVNDAYLQLVGKQRAELENRTIWESVPEAAASYAPIMNEVITTGTAFVAKEHELVLIRSGIPESVFVDFVYEPMKIDDKVNAIMVLAIDVTDKVVARRSIEDVEERIRLAIEAAEIGTFDLDLVKGDMLCSERFNKIFGYDTHMPWQTMIKSIHPDDWAVRDAAHKTAISTGKMFYEARVIHPDKTIHWVRVQGKVYYDNAGKPLRILGTLLDITQFKNLERQKDDFISIASHELKTPITSLKASLQLLVRLKGDPASPIMPKLIDQSVKSMQKVDKLVNDLLNVSRTKEAQLLLNKTTFTVAEMLNSCCNHVRAEGKYTLTLQGDEQVTLYADENAIDQVVVNFVNNAVKYAPDAPEIFLIIEKLPNAVKISVKDTGPGIAPDKIPYLFDRYFQAQATGFTNSGLGLGLYISAEIVRKHGGEIGVDSELGKGSTFWFIIPVEGDL